MVTLIPKYGRFRDVVLCCAISVALIVSLKRTSRAFGLLAAAVFSGWLTYRLIFPSFWTERAKLASHFAVRSFASAYPLLQILFGLYVIIRLFQSEGVTGIRERLRKKTDIIAVALTMYLGLCIWNWFRMDREFTLNGVAKGLSFAVRAEATDTMMLQFSQEHAIRYPDFTSRVLLKSSQDTPYMAFGWYTTFARFMYCDPKLQTSSEMAFAISEQQPFGLTLSFEPSGQGCKLSAFVSRLPHVDGSGFQLYNVSNLAEHLYTLEIPSGRDVFGVSFSVAGGELPWTGRDQPIVKWFVFFPSDKLQLRVFTHKMVWDKAADQEAVMPEKITLTTDVFGGPRVIRSYSLQSTTPRMVAFSKNSSTWVFTWERADFAVQGKLGSDPVQ
jgi:hypothetical protein